MQNYKQLAFRYLKLNKRRSIVTILGVAVATMVLYLMLNMGWSAILNQRKVEREKQDYEIVLLTETSEQIEQIMKDPRVKSAKTGDYYEYDYYNPVTFKNALYINTTNPYRLDSYLEYFKTTYQVEGYLNDILAATYLQGFEGNLIYILILLALLVSFLFAIFGVGIVRSSIQMSTLEQIKDYGNLRCIGASKGQLKEIVYLEGAVLEVIGIAFGIIFGSLISLVIGYRISWEAGFHIVPAVPIVIAFLGDWYFAMEENCKVIVNLTPVSAIRGEYRIRKEKIKIRKRSIFGKWFGIEGDYAYKSIMRNKGRFYRTVAALSICIAAFMTVAGLLTSIWSIKNKEEQEFGYYQIYFENELTPTKTISETQSGLPNMEILKKISELDGMTESKRIYNAMLLPANMDKHYSHYTKNYLDYLDDMGANTYYTGDETNEEFRYVLQAYGRISCYGYDETDYERYQDALVEGTLDVSENGIVIFKNAEISFDDGEHLTDQEKNIEIMDYKLGDTIEIVNMEKFRKMMEVELEDLEKEYEKEKKELEEAIATGGEIKEEYAKDPLVDPHYFLETEFKHNKRYQKMIECRGKLIDAGEFKTYTIEGIVSGNVIHETVSDFTIILPLEKYYEVTGTDETMSTGMQYHFDKFPLEKYENIFASIPFEYECFGSSYSDFLALFTSMERVGYGVLLVILFIVTMTTFNVINTTAGNLHSRRKELAQLRVLGVSKDRLMKMVMLEGVIETIVANVIGIILGVVISYGVFRVTLTLLFGVKYHFPFAATLVAFLVTTGILCGSVYYSLKGLKQDVAGDLATGGD